MYKAGTDKVPGPDGFTFGFFRHFWHLVDRDVCEAVRYFFKFSDLPKGCNSSFIALIPKIPDANLVKDFRPISLIGSIYKIIAKILTNRLVDVLGGIINEVQSAFIKDRQILDGPFILNEVMSWCKKKKKQTLLFKVDFEKAYDSVRWDFLDDVLGKFGFGDKWRKWIQCCLHSSKGSIIINGSPTDEFQFGRGLKQGDPLSPFLFLLIMESLHISFQRVVDAGMFHGIDVGGLVNLSHMFYADDAVFIGEWSESNITSLIHVLDCFHKVSGLKINMCKSKIMGIEVDNGKVSRAATKFGCLVLKAPFLYLGSYVGGDMNKIQSWKDIIDRIRRRLSRWKMKMLSIGGRLMLIKSVLGSMPIFHMSMFKVPAGVIQILESLRSKFFNGHESSGKKASWVQWKKALAPKDNGGLGIFSLYALNRGLIFKWVWRFLAHEPTLWSRVIKAIHGANGKIDEISGKGANSCWINIIKEVRRLEEKGINLLLFMKKKLGNGLSTLFWDDVWCDGGKLKNRFPRAYALENSKQITVGQKLAHPSLYHSFRRHPRGGLELTQVEELAKVINPVVLTQSPDSWSWTLNNSGGYTVASSRNMIDSRLLPKGDLKTRWIRYVPNKVNTFAWKVMTNSLPTRFNISRRGIDIESLSCVNCDVGIETNDHLFFACNTAKKISKLINRWWDVPFMDINSYGEWRSWIDNVKLPKKNKSMFQDELVTDVASLVIRAYDSNSTLKSHINHPHCEAKKRGTESGKSSMSRDGSIFVYNPDVLREQFAGLVIQRGLPFNHFDDEQTTRVFQKHLQPRYAHAKETMFPVLSRMAMDILSVQATSVASESAFSTSGRVLSIRRTRLTPASLEMCMCLKDHLDAQERKQDKSTLETPVDFEEEVLDGPPMCKQKSHSIIR
ncbi:RNA-directed DNA polymerase, eukaryota [Tanacetum coccineum]